jgi:RNA polymerase sigma-70 factor (ECF subfamily)
VERTARLDRNARERADRDGVVERDHWSQGSLEDEQLERDFENFVLEARNGLVTFGMVLTGDFGVAQDLAQEALVRTWQRWRRVHELERPQSWSRRVLHNLAVDHLRHRRREARFRSERREPYNLQIEDEGLLGAIRGLEPGPRKALFLHYFLGLPLTEIALELGVPTGTVGSWLSRSRAAIAERLDDSRSHRTGGDDRNE